DPAALTPEDAAPAGPQVGDRLLAVGQLGGLAVHEARDRARQLALTGQQAAVPFGGVVDSPAVGGDLIDALDGEQLGALAVGAGGPQGPPAAPVGGGAL